MKPNRLWAVCLAALVVLAGCVGLPRSGRVNSVSPSKTSSGAIGFAVQPPARNATPQQIVEGFLLASRAGLDDDFAVARQYLYGDAAANWKPLARVRVYPDSQDVSTTVTESGAVRASVASRGTLSSHGTYTETANSAVLTTEFSLAKNADGQWRIVSLDDGVFLSENAFSQQFIETPLYFLAPDSNALVADLRYYPRRTFATSAMNGLLAGPSEWLASGVHTAVPTGTKLLKSVDVVDGEATVDLSSVVLAASAKERAALLEQITRTLKASSSVRSVVLKVEGADLNVGSIQSLPTYPYGSYPVSVISGGLPANVSDNRITPLMGDAGLKAHGLSNLAISYQASRGRLAALGRGGTELIGMDSGSGSWQVLHSGKSLVQPSYDRYGWVWSAERDNAGKILVFKPGENASAHLDVSWLNGAKIRDVSVSRDGSRMVVVCEIGGEVTIRVAAIARDGAGRPTQIGDSIIIGQHLSDVTAAEWIGPSTVAVLGKTTLGGERAMFSVKISGPTERLAAPYEGTVSITAGHDEDSIVALTDKKTAYARDGGAWRAIVSDVTSVAYPG
ncbi:MAG: LpqB family beta-propeller domain-containing protein [Peptidiphaga sp.]